MGWKLADVDLYVISVHEQCIHCRVTVPGQNFDFLVTMMYGMDYILLMIE